MKNLLILAFIFVSGCSNSADRWEIDYAQAKCETRGGIHHIVVHILGTLDAWCMDGKKVVVPLTPITGEDNNAED